ncbi:MAG TPA: hypothetical protein DEH78_08005 [Solibacterales bacterium]|nr:hypothetical protein [Bryobacterales bacterium]
MRAVWSFWTPPFRAQHRDRWVSSRQHLLSWILSVETARRHYPDTALVTDREGADLLVGDLGLPFAEVSTALDGLRGEDLDWWVHGKLQAYALQSRPFVHLDYDVYLWERLPPRLEWAPVFAQNPEGVDIGCYEPDDCEAAIVRMGEGSIPPEWKWYRETPGQVAACCGIVGGCDTQLLRHYANTALGIIRSKANGEAFAALPNKGIHNMLFEQYLLCAVAAYHGSEVEFLFESFGEALSDEAAARVGYTHLMASAKSNPGVADRLERRVARDHRDLYQRAVRIAALRGEDRGAAAAGHSRM